MYIQWFPEYMTKAMRMMEENVKLVDVIVFVNCIGNNIYNKKIIWYNFYEKNSKNNVTFHKKDIVRRGYNAIVV